MNTTTISQDNVSSCLGETAQRPGHHAGRVAAPTPTPDWDAIGYRDGLDAFRIVGPNEVPSKHPQGHTPEGVEWFLACIRGLLHARKTVFQSESKP